MNPYDEPTSRRARWDDDYPGARDYAEADRSEGRASVGRASVGRATVRGASEPVSVGYGPDPYGPDAYGPTYDPYGQGRDPYASPMDPPISPVPGGAMGRAVVGRAAVRPVSPSAPAGPGLDPEGPGDYGRGRPGGPGGRGPRGPYDDEDGDGERRRRPRVRETDPKKAKKARRRNLLIAAFAVFIMLTGAGVVGATYYVGNVPTPGQLDLPESTTVYYSDGKKVMARLGSENRTLLAFEDMNDAVKWAIVAAEDQSFWSNEGVDFKAVVRAAWNNFTGGPQQGGSTLTQQYARIASELKGATYSRKVKEAVIAWKLDDQYSKSKILEFYLNTVPFGRGAYGIEAAAQAYFGKSASKKAAPANQVTLAEAIVLASQVKQPEPEPGNAINAPGYDPTRLIKQDGKNVPNPVAVNNANDRFEYVKQGVIKLVAAGLPDEAGKITAEQANAAVYPTDTLKAYTKTTAGLDKPTGLVVQHALSEIAQSSRFKDQDWDYIRNGGFKIVTTVNYEAQVAAERAADETQKSSTMSNHSKKLQAALVAVEPGKGRVLAYYGGHNGAGSDYAGWYYDEDGVPTGYGAHPPGSSGKVYTLAAAIKDGISLDSWWDSKSGRKFPGRGAPVRNASSCFEPYGKRNGPCTLLGSTIASLNVPFFAVTQAIGSATVMEMAKAAGIDFMWTDDRERVDLTAHKSMSEVSPSKFNAEVGFGQYPITVADHANGLATFAAGGVRAKLHFVKTVSKGKDIYYSERVPGDDAPRIMNGPQIADLTFALSKVSSANLQNGWDAAGKTGTWQYRDSAEQNAHAWMVGFTKRIAAAVWVGNKAKEAAIKKPGGANMYGADAPATIWRQFIKEATTKMKLEKNGSQFPPRANVGDDQRGEIQSPTPPVPTFDPFPSFPPGDGGPGGGDGGGGGGGGGGGPGGGGGGGGGPGGGGGIILPPPLVIRPDARGG
jgi:membrane peptidoglycan carboxypeptidase